MTGTIVQVSISAGGLPKRAIPEALITPLGIEGDAHAHPAIHGGPRMAILLIAAEAIEQLLANGYPLFPGALGENLTTRGIDVRKLRIGDRLQVGRALLEITKPRNPCLQLDVYGPSLKADISDERVRQLDHSSPRWGMSGFYASVVTLGAIRAGDIITVVSPQT